MRPYLTPEDDDEPRIGTPCWHCRGSGRVPIAITTDNEDETRQCGACDGWGYR